VKPDRRVPSPGYETVIYLYHLEGSQFNRVNAKPVPREPEFLGKGDGIATCPVTGEPVDQS
jgi:hypothetical protein